MPASQAYQSVPLVLPEEFDGVCRRQKMLHHGRIPPELHKIQDND